MSIEEKIKKVEALIAGALTEGERLAAQFAKKRLLSKLVSKPIEYSVRANSLWKKKLFVSICNKHGLHTYRYKRQKHTTTMVKVTKPFMDEVLWPEFKRYAKLFDTLASDIIDDLIGQIHDIEPETVIPETTPELPSHTTSL